MQRINEVIEAVWAKRRQIIIESKSPHAPINIAVYMDYEYYSMCKSEINGEVPASVHEFFDRDTILGFQVYKVYKVYKVVPMHTRHVEIKHPPFKVVNLDG